MTTTTSKPWWHSRWWMPSFCVFLGTLTLAALWAGGQPKEGLLSFAALAVAGAVFLFGARRSETIAGLGGPGRDERWAMIDLRATALSGAVMLCVIIAAWLVSLARGHDGSPYGQLMAVSGIVYILGVVVLRRRA